MAEVQTTVTLSPAQLEQLIRRIVREEVSRLLQPSKPSVLDDWSHEGPEDPEGDAELLQEALQVIRQREEHPGTSVGWEEFKAELRQAEAAGELPD
jgi:hypothetical protein